MELNYFAILLAAVFGMAFGMLWYSRPLFGRMWMKWAHVSNHKPAANVMMRSTAIGFLAQLVMALVLAQFMKLAVVTGAIEAMELSFWIWLGFMMPLTMGASLWENKTFKLFFLNAAFWLISLLLMSLVLFFV